MKTTAIVLNWNEAHVSVESTLRLIEDEIDVIVVDNGSTDHSVSCFRNIGGITFLNLAYNRGSSVARNVGLQLVNTPYTFLIDGDILYVPGTIKYYQRILDKFSKAGCVGFCDYDILRTTGQNGVLNKEEADTKFTPDKLELLQEYGSRIDQTTYSLNVEDWFPMAWTQYGLFRTDLLKEIGFVTIPPFNEPGHGFEDDWLFHEMRLRGYNSIACNKPRYFHDAHYSLRELEKLGLPSKTEDRKQVFQKYWGKHSGWQTQLSLGMERTGKTLSFTE